MKLKELTQNVCVKLAEELVSIETEVAKQNALLESVKGMIADKKTDVIRNILVGEELHFPSKTYMTLEVELGKEHLCKDDFVVFANLATDPKWVEDSGLKLSAAETKLFAVYKEAYENFYIYMDKDEIEKMKNAAQKMRGLKNKLNLMLIKFWTFEYEDATKERFFEETGVRVFLSSARKPTLEQLIYVR